MQVRTKMRPRMIEEAVQGAEIADCQELRMLVWGGNVPETAETRGLMWQLFLEYVPEDRHERVKALMESRGRYWSLIEEITTHPTESAPEDDHPLSLNEDSHWARFFTVRESERLIVLDVKRTHPTLSQFRELEDPMRRILLAFALNQQEIGYRQGMNELLAPLLYVFCNVAEVRDAEADSYHCLCTILKEMSPLYMPNGDALRHEFDRLKEILRMRDPELFKHLNSIGVEPNLYGTRWLRLWVTQEFQLAETLVLWDSILTVQPRLPWLRCICVAMVVAVRDRLLASDFQTAAQILLRYSKNNVPVRLILNLADAIRTGDSAKTHLREANQNWQKR